MTHRLATIQYITLQMTTDDTATDGRSTAVRLKVEIHMQKSEIQHRPRNPLQHPQKLSNYQLHFIPYWAKKIGELWSTNKKVIGAHPHKWTFSGY